MPHHPGFTPSGTVVPGSKPLRDAFIANLTRGAALQMTLAGKTVVDPWGGYNDAAG